MVLLKGVKVLTHGQWLDLVMGVDTVETMVRL